MQQMDMGRRRTLFAIAIIVAVLAAARTWHLRSDPVRQLVTLVGQRRVTEARISGGFEWAPLPRKAIRAPIAVRPDPASRVRGEAQTRASVSRGRSAHDDHAGAMATLLF